MMNDWEKLIKAPGIENAHFMLSNNVRHFKLIAQPIKQKLLANLTIDAKGYNGSTPGPLIVARQGEWIAITVENRMSEDTALHVHGYVKPNSQDGAPDVGEPTPVIKPGKSYTYRFFLWQSGSFFYHSTHAFQSNEGLIGSLVVLPKSDNASVNSIPDGDYVFLLQQWEVPQPALGKVYPGTYKVNKFGRNPNFFTINGKAFPDTAPVYIKSGQRIRMRFMNKSNSSHSMHLHGHDFRVVAVDAFPRTNLIHDTINVASGQRWDIEFLAQNPGLWPLNGTKTFHRSNNGETPGGMVTRIIYV